jgi:Tfp pilus assembly protein PilE
LRARGYTLIEGLFALLLAAILMRLAWAGYEATLRRTHRTLAQARLLEAALWLEQQRALHLRHGGGDGGGPPELPPGLRELHAQGAVRYRLRVEWPEAGGYRLVAEPEGWTDADCGDLTLDDRGRRAASGQRPGAACWRP